MPEGTLGHTDASPPQVHRPDETTPWDAVAGNYAQYVDPHSVAMARPALRFAPVGPDDTVIDVAAGPGGLTLLAARDAARVLAVDISAVFVDILRERARHAGLRNVSVEQMDGQDLRIGDAAFDRAYSMLGLMMFDDRARGFAEMHRVLAPGGMAVVSAFSPPNTPFAILQRAMAEALPDLTKRPPPPGSELGDPDRFRSEMQDAGFAQARVETVQHTVEWPNADQHWNAIARSNPVFGPLLDQMDEYSRVRLEETAMRILEGMAEPDGRIRQRVDVHYAVGQKA